MPSVPPSAIPVSPDASANGVAEAEFTAAPRSAILVALHAYWLAKRGDRAMPSRADIDPAEIKGLLPHVMLYDAAPATRYRIRLVGEAIVQFVGRNMTGHDAGTGMDPQPAAMMRAILDAVADGGAPRFRAGKAYWWKEKAYRDFEACFLPLSPDGKAVNIILAGVVFDVGDVRSTKK